MQKVLVAPLDWGLGHTTRCIPVIEQLKKSGVSIACLVSKRQKDLLGEIFSDIEFIDSNGYNITYPSSGNLAIAMLLQIPKLLSGIRKENKQISKLIAQYGITHIISDNRFGLYNSSVKTAFITHQVHLEAPALLKPVLFYLNRYFIEKFDQMWIPDNPPPGNLAGSLSSPSGIRIPYFYTGPLTRLTGLKPGNKKVFDIILLISGPEPQRSYFEKQLLEHYNFSDKSMLVIRGLPGLDENIPSKKGITFLNHISGKHLAELLHPETVLICRSGYSTLMDLYSMNHSRTILIPTPGQTEQEYLASYWNKQFGFNVLSQKSFAWDKTDLGTKAFPAFDNRSIFSGLDPTLKRFLESKNQQN
ncbi:MAG TPA: glycosyl transferase family 28 [Bacteroidia bacterium]|nr:glycosyl transferase family 28 [Bacteroidia bacterium]